MDTAIDRRGYISQWHHSTTELEPELHVGDVVEFRRLLSPCTGVSVYSHFGLFVGYQEQQPHVAHFGRNAVVNGSTTESSDEHSSCDAQLFPEEPTRKKWRLRFRRERRQGSKMVVQSAPIGQAAGEDECRVNNGVDLRAVPLDAQEIIRRARESLGTGKYNLLFFNCEHFSNWCRTGLKYSKQVVFYTVLGLAIIGIVFISAVVVYCMIKFSWFLVATAARALFV